MSTPRTIPPTDIPQIEIDAAANAMKAINDEAEARGEAGVSWFYLAQVALEAARMVRGKPSIIPGGVQ